MLKEPALLDQAGSLSAQMFSSPLLGKVYSQLLQRHKSGLEVSLGGLTDVTSEEMSHMAGIVHRHQGPVSQQAMRDCVDTIRDESRAAGVATDDALLAHQQRMKERKGIRG